MTTPQEQPAVDTSAEADMLAALRSCQTALAMMIAPDAIRQTSVLHAFAQATEAEAKARAVIAKADARSLAAQPAEPEDIDAATGTADDQSDLGAAVEALDEYERDGGVSLNDLKRELGSEPDYVDKLDFLFEEFGRPAGTNRLAWLRAQFAELAALRQPAEPEGFETTQAERESLGIILAMEGRPLDADDEYVAIRLLRDLDRALRENAALRALHDDMVASGIDWRSRAEKAEAALTKPVGDAEVEKLIRQLRDDADDIENEYGLIAGEVHREAIALLLRQARTIESMRGAFNAIDDLIEGLGAADTRDVATNKIAVIVFNAIVDAPDEARASLSADTGER